MTIPQERRIRMWIACHPSPGWGFCNAESRETSTVSQTNVWVGSCKLVWAGCRQREAAVNPPCCVMWKRERTRNMIRTIWPSFNTLSCLLTSRIATCAPVSFLSWREMLNVDVEWTPSICSEIRIETFSQECASGECMGSNLLCVHKNSRNIQQSSWGH